MNKIFQIIKKILGFIIKEIFSFCIKFALMLFVLILFLGGIVSYFSKQSTTKINEGTYVLIQAGSELTEHIPLPDPFSLKENPLTFLELLYSLDNIRQDHRIDGVLLDVDSMTWNKAQVEELGKKFQLLEDQGYLVISLLQNADRNNYLMASFAGSIYMPPVHAATSDITAYHYEELYWKSLLDRFGVKMNVIPIGDYKSYMENYARGEMSPEFRENTTHLLDTAYQYSLDLIAKNRKMKKEDLAKLIESGELMGTSYHTLLKHDLISKGAYKSEVYEDIGKDKIISIEDYYQQIKPKHHSGKYIALLALEGTIEDENLFISEVEKIEEDPDVAGVVLRINSPGGSALASDIMYHAVKRLRKKVPVYTSISGVAASGGYYVASAGEKIFAPALSITGSIGVVSMMPNISDLQKKASVKSEEIIKGKYADLYSSSKPLSKENFERIRESNLGVYEDFLQVVSENRKIDKEFLDKNLAQGRVWLGLEAKEQKLVDEIGGLEDAIYALEKDKNLGPLPIVEISENDVLEAYFGKYRKFLSWLPMSFQAKPPKDSLWNKPLMYLPYEIQ